MSSGQPRVEWGHKPELNQVSSTSGSCSSLAEPQAAQLVGSSTVTVKWSQSPQYQTGIRCPHHSWRLIHQSRMFSSQLRYTRVNRSGTTRISPPATAACARPAMLSVSSCLPKFTNHWRLINGSTTEAHLWQWPTE